MTGHPRRSLIRRRLFSANPDSMNFKFYMKGFSIWSRTAEKHEVFGLYLEVGSRCPSAILRSGSRQRSRKGSAPIHNRSLITGWCQPNTPDKQLVKMSLGPHPERRNPPVGIFDQHLKVKKLHQINFQKERRVASSDVELTRLLPPVEPEWISLSGSLKDARVMQCSNQQCCYKSPIPFGKVFIIAHTVAGLKGAAPASHWRVRPRTWF